jgi:phage baseplate assembly protein W
VALSRRGDDIREAIAMILSTPKGQRVMRPEFGCQIHDLLFAPNDATTAGLAAYYVEEALLMWEPRIRVLECTAWADRDDPYRLLILIRYEILATYDERTLVYPFYRIPDLAPPAPATPTAPLPPPVGR